MVIVEADIDLVADVAPEVVESVLPEHDLVRPACSVTGEDRRLDVASATIHADNRHAPAVDRDIVESQEGPGGDVVPAVDDPGDRCGVEAAVSRLRDHHVVPRPSVSDRMVDKSAQARTEHERRDDRKSRDGTREQRHAGRDRRAVLVRVEREVGAQHRRQRRTDSAGGVDDPRRARRDHAVGYGRRRPPRDERGHREEGEREHAGGADHDREVDVDAGVRCDVAELSQRPER